MLDGYKELTPVVYGENGVKYLYAARKTPGELCFALHWHDRIELLCVERGSLRLNTAEGHEELCPGQVAVIGSRQLHGGIAGRDGVVYHTIMFDVEKLCNGTLASEKYLLPLCRNEVAFRRIVSDKQLLEAIYRLVGARRKRTRRAGTWNGIHCFPRAFYMKSWEFCTDIRIKAPESRADLAGDLKRY